MKKIIGLAALLAGTAGMFALPAAAEGRRADYTAPMYTQTYNGYAIYSNGYYGDHYDRRVRVDRDHRNIRRDRDDRR
jgi:hypothetical protein